LRPKAARLARHLLSIALLAASAYDQPRGVPTFLTIPAVGGITIFTVTSPFSDCFMTIDAILGNPFTVTIDPTHVSGVTQQTFTVKAIAAGTVTVTLSITTTAGCNGGLYQFTGTVGTPSSVNPTRLQVPETETKGEPVSTATGELYEPDLAPFEPTAIPR
jgi:hypothetical protein